MSFQQPSNRTIVLFSISVFWIFLMKEPILAYKPKWRIIQWIANEVTNILCILNRCICHWHPIDCFSNTSEYLHNQSFSIQIFSLFLKRNSICIVRLIHMIDQKRIVCHLKIDLSAWLLVWLTMWKWLGGEWLDRREAWVNNIILIM